MSVKITDRLQRVRSYGERLVALGPGVIWFANHDLGSGLCFPITRLGYRVRLAGPTGAVESFASYVNPTQYEQRAYFLFPLDRNIAPVKVRIKHGDFQAEAEVVVDSEKLNSEVERSVLPSSLAKLFHDETERVFALDLGLVTAGEQVDIQILYACVISERAEEGRGLSFRLPLMVSRALTTLSNSDMEQNVLASGLERGASLVVNIVLDTADLQPGRIATSQACGMVRQANGELMIENDRRKPLEPRDFVLDYQLWCGAQPRAWLRVQNNQFLLSLFPPAAEAPTLPRKLVFLIDGSEEMANVGTERCYEFVSRTLGGLDGRDTFALVTFNRDVAGFKSGDFVEVSNANDALQWLREYEFTGIADLKGLLERVVKLPRQDDFSLIIVLLVAGRIGNEPELYRLLVSAREGMRVYPVMLGRKANPHFARAASRVTGGKAFRPLNFESISRASERLLEETRWPIFDAIGIQDRGLSFQVDSITPRYPSGLSSYASLDILGVCAGSGGVEVSGKSSLGPSWGEVVQPKEVSHRVLPLAWALAKANELDDEARMAERSERTALQNLVFSLTNDFMLSNPYSSFLVRDNQSPQAKLAAFCDPGRWGQPTSGSGEGARTANELLEEQRAIKGIRGGRQTAVGREGLMMKESLGKGAVTTVIGSKIGGQTRLSSGMKSGIFNKPMYGAGQPDNVLPPRPMRPAAEPRHNKTIEPLEAQLEPIADSSFAPSEVSSKPKVSDSPRVGEGPPKQEPAFKPAAIAKDVVRDEPGDQQSLPTSSSTPALPPVVAAKATSGKPVSATEGPPALPRISIALPLPTPQALAAMVTAKGMSGAPEETARAILRENEETRERLMKDMRTLHRALAKSDEHDHLFEYLDAILRPLAEIAPESKLLVQAYGLGYQCRSLLEEKPTEGIEKIKFWLSRFAKLF